jgi:hypothetical protein
MRQQHTLARGLLGTLAIATFLCPAAGCGDGDDGAAPDAGNKLVVMTLDVNYGFDADRFFSVQSPDDFPLLAAQAYQQLLSTSFPERAQAIADEIARKRPHLIGLQEVALFRIQSPGDSSSGGTLPAESVLMDYLDILLQALAIRGLDYRVAGKVRNVDVEVPMATDDPAVFDDIRLTDHDVVLARGDVQVSSVVGASFLARISIPENGAEVPRGYVALDATVDGRTYRFVTTHLEDTPYPDVQLAQARELAAALSMETRPVVLAGNFNLPAPSDPGYLYLASQGYQDAWLINSRQDQGEGLTWGHDPDLRTPDDQFTLRIDFVFIRQPGPASPGPVTVRAEVWGADPEDRTVSGLWPSTHAAVVAELVYPPLQVAPPPPPPPPPPSTGGGPTTVFGFIGFIVLSLLIGLSGIFSALF